MKFRDESFLWRCREELADHYCENNPVQISADDVYVVWFCKTLQNAKALLITNKNDGAYYEFTFNGDKNELYMDAYKKQENKLIPW